MLDYMVKPLNDLKVKSKPFRQRQVEIGVSVNFIILK